MELKSIDRAAGIQYIARGTLTLERVSRYTLSRLDRERTQQTYFAREATGLVAAPECRVMSSAL